MSQTPQSAGKATDPRITRSRQMLMDALGRLLSKKDFEDISVQEIADETTLNRATFYLLYPDKNQSSRNDKREGVSQLHSRTEALINQCLENGGMPISSIQE